MISIRRLTPSDIDAIMAIETESFASPWTESMVENEFALDHSRLTGLFENGSMAGFCVSWVILDEGHIADIAVGRDFRQKGFGRMLLDSILEDMRAAGVKKVFLELRRSNIPARKLYEKTGFEPIGVRKNYYSDDGEDALVMQLSLD